MQVRSATDSIFVTSETAEEANDRRERVLDALLGLHGSLQQRGFQLTRGTGNAATDANENQWRRVVVHPDRIEHHSMNERLKWQYAPESEREYTHIIRHQDPAIPPTPSGMFTPPRGYPEMESRKYVNHRDMLIDYDRRHGGQNASS